jgi:hypothetical protein
MTLRTGCCQCRAIQFEFDGEPSDASFCHCSICRRLSGSAFAAYIEIPAPQLRVSDDSNLLSRYDVTSRLEKQSCSRCGTSLFTRHSDFPDLVYASLGALDDDSGLVPEYHQFVASKANWYTIADDLPQFAEWPKE